MNEYTYQRPEQQWPPPQTGYPVATAPPPRSRFWVGFATGVGATLLAGAVGLLLLLGLGVFLLSSSGVGAPADDALLDRLYQDCSGGDMAACDDLYYESALGSEREEFGGTCGGRLPEFTWASCTDLDL